MYHIKTNKNKTLSNQTTLTGDIAELKNKLTGEVNEINKLQQGIEDLNKQILDLNDRYTETKQKLEKQNLGINCIGTYLVENKTNKKKFKEDWEDFTKTNIVSQRGVTRENSLTKESKLEQEKPSDDQY